METFLDGKKYPAEKKLSERIAAQPDRQFRRNGHRQLKSRSGHFIKTGKELVFPLGLLEDSARLRHIIHSVLLCQNPYPLADHRFIGPDAKIVVAIAITNVL
jgi:hypothetical protein